MGRYADMTLEQYDVDIRQRLSVRSKSMAKEFQERAEIDGNYQAAQRVLAHDPNYSERKMGDEWTGAGRNDPIFVLEYLNKLRSLVSEDLSRNRYWKFASSWLNDQRRFGGRSELDQVLWVKLLVPQYDLPFIRSSGFGIMMTHTELDQLRFQMRMPPFLIGRRLGYDSKPLTPEDIHRVMTAFDAMKTERPNVVVETKEDMMRYAEWLASPLSSDLTGQRAVERALEPIQKIGQGIHVHPKMEPKICPVGHKNPPNAKFCGFCNDPYQFPALPRCNQCETVAVSETQKRCNECGGPLESTSTVPANSQERSDVQETAEDNGLAYDGDDPFTDEPPRSAPSVPSVSKSLRQKWGRNLCDVETDEVLISSVAVHLGFPNGTLEHNLYLPQSREAYERLMHHFKERCIRK